MDRTEIESLGDLLRGYIEESGNSRRFDEVTACTLWPQVVGADLASQTLRPMVKKGMMTIKVPSAALRHELNMRRSALAAAINREVGKDVITQLKFI